MSTAQNTSDSRLPAWTASLAIHLCLLVLLAQLTLSLPVADRDFLLSATSDIDEPDELQIEEFETSVAMLPEVGIEEAGGILTAKPVAVEQAPLAEVPEPEVLIVASDVQIPVTAEVETPRGPIDGTDVVVRGSGNAGIAGTTGAIDRITHEIMLSLEQRPTLVVWLFDQSGSLSRQREAVRERFDRIYEELGVIEASTNPAFARHEDKPLLTSVVAFGKQTTFLNEKPTDQIDEIKRAVAAIVTDPSGQENVFAAVSQVAQEYLRYRVQNPRHNVMIVVFTDEVGDDPEHLEDAVQLCRTHQIPVYVVGVPAPFGRREAMVKYVDPNPEFDQRPQRAPVNQGPESLYPERIKLRFAGMRSDDELFDSGFGPYGLTRLCMESGGLFFSVHPNRATDRRVRGGEIAELAAYFVRFFESDVMRKYRPEYISIDQYERALRQNKARQALVDAARLSWTTPMESVRLTFPKRDEGALANLLSLAQRDAAKLEPKINMIYDALRSGESDRARLVTPRWQAGYDLAMGRAMAVKVRTEGYNAMLARAKNGMAFENEKSDTWRLKPADKVESDSALAGAGQRARTYLERVIQEHPSTPWAVLAERELEQPLGWDWTELYAGVNVPPERVGGENANPPRDDRRNPLVKPKPRRKPPAL